MKKILILLFGLLSFSDSFCQSPDLAAEAKALFNENTKLKWVKDFKGRINNYNDIALAIAYDGWLCKGVIQHVRSGEQFSLDGILEKNQLILKEIDANGNISGYLKGSYEKNTFNGNWSNFDNSVGSPIHFRQFESKSLVPSFCGNDKWLRHYTATFGKQAIEIFIQKGEEDRVSGIVFFKQEKKSLNATGNWSKETGLHLQLRDNYGKNFAKIIAPKISQKELKGSIIYNQKDFINCKFKLSGKLGVGCIEQSDYLSNYDLIFPKTSNAVFNNWIESLVTEEAKNLSKIGNQAIAQKASFTPEDRYQNRSNGWFEVGFFDENLISGILFLESTIKSPNAVSVNFDLKNNRLILFEDIFREEYDRNYFVENVIRWELTKHERYSTDPAFRQWIKSVDFPQMILLKNGLHFSTNFNPIYGRQGITIPYEKLKSFVKKDSWVDFSFRK